MSPIVTLKGCPLMRRQRNWANYDHVLYLIASSPSSANISAAKALFTSIHDSIGTKERAPALALLHLDARVRSLAPEGVKAMGDEDYKSAVEAYWRRWGSKGVVVDDLAGQWEGKEILLASTVQAWTEEGHVSHFPLRQLRRNSIVELC